MKYKKGVSFEGLIPKIFVMLLLFGATILIFNMFLSSQKDVSASYSVSDDLTCLKKGELYEQTGQQYQDDARQDAGQRRG